MTGAARGIGYAYCERLAADGANVVAVDIDDPANAVTQLTGSGDGLGLVCDISEPSQVDAVVGTVLDRYGHCDILVNNAGVFPFTDLDHVTIELWRRVQAVNVEAILLFTQAFAPGMRAVGWGRVVNTGSGITTTQNRDLAYMTSKGTVHALTRALANELGDSGITVNAIAPGLVATQGFLGRVRTNGPTADEVVARMTAMQTIKRRSVPADLGSALGFLVSDDAGFVTGQILHVDGGVTRTGARPCPTRPAAPPQGTGPLPARATESTYSISAGGAGRQGRGGGGALAQAARRPVCSGVPTARSSGSSASDRAAVAPTSARLCASGRSSTPWASGRWISTGTYSRVWSAWPIVGSFPWSPVTISRSPGAASSATSPARPASTCSSRCPYRSGSCWCPARSVSWTFATTRASPSARTASRVCDRTSTVATAG
ncbi:SDR family oxidoreductase [Streptomyces sp. SID8360]|nr:SDR family oxidoreductase [Streptomyces sp. SID8360]